MGAARKSCFLPDRTLDDCRVGDAFPLSRNKRKAGTVISGRSSGLNDDGSVPRTIPLCRKSKARCRNLELYGHRNPQRDSFCGWTGVSLTMNILARRGGDEITRLKRGANYGWRQHSLPGWIYSVADFPLLEAFAGTRTLRLGGISRVDRAIRLCAIFWRGFPDWE